MISLRPFRREPATLDLPDRLDALEAAVRLADGRLDGADVEFARAVAEKARSRLRHGTAHTLVALLGATGSGKSSLANAISRTDAATIGVRRPTTSSTLAMVWGADDATALLDWLEVENRHLLGTTDRNGLDGLVLLDVPDHDSVAVGHRLEMERIANHADLLLWVTDPEKYADDAMHRYLRLLDHHGAVTLMVLNKVDRLDQPQLEACLADLERLMSSDGITEPKVFPVSATTGRGVDALDEELEASVSRQRAATERLAADVAVAADELAAASGSGRAATFDESLARHLALDLADASGVAIVADAAAAAYRHDAARRTGWPLTRWVRRLRPNPLRRLHLDPASAGRSSLPSPSGAQTARAQAAIRAVAEAAADGLTEPWPTLYRRAATPDQRSLHDRLDLGIAEAVRTDRRTTAAWWSFFGVLQMLLALVALGGGLWLTALAANNWLQLPEFDTPNVWRVPLPTLLLIVGLVGGWSLALLARFLARLGAVRRARSVRSQAAESVERIAEELVLAPLRAEVAARTALVDQLRLAGASPDRLER